MGSLTLRIVSPAGPILEAEVASVQFPGGDGSFGILPRHAAMTSLTESGLLTGKVADGSKIERIIHDGFAQIKDNVVTVLTRSAETPAEVNLERARESAKRAQDRLQNPRPEYDLVRVQASLRRALMREKLSRS